MSGLHQMAKILIEIMPQRGLSATEGHFCTSEIYLPQIKSSNHLWKDRGHKHQPQGGMNLDRIAEELKTYQGVNDC